MENYPIKRERFESHLNRHGSRNLKRLGFVLLSISPRKTPIFPQSSQGRLSGLVPWPHRGSLWPPALWGAQAGLPAPRSLSVRASVEPPERPGKSTVATASPTPGCRHVGEGASGLSVLNVSEERPSNTIRCKVRVLGSEEVRCSIPLSPSCMDVEHFSFLSCDGVVLWADILDENPS